jgi:SAM-dependent methyltransferase
VRGWLRKVRDRLGQSSERIAYAESELLSRAHEFNRNAERYWREVAGEASGRRHVLNKPFASIQAAPDEVYRLGLMLTELRLGVGLTILDFGAGSCWLSSCLNRLGCRTVAVDVSPTALELGQELFRMDARHRPELAPQFLPYDGRRIPLDDQSVDRIACFDAFHHVPNQHELLSEMFRVLRWGGRAVLSEPGEGHTHSDMSAFDEARFGVLENELDPLELEGRARRAGFTDVTLKPYPHSAVMTVTPRDYVQLIRGDLRTLPLTALPQSLRGHFTFTLAKGEHVPDSRCPGRLRAELRLVDPTGELIGVGGHPLPLLIEARNTGDTLWRHDLGALGGDVLLGSHLLDENRRLVRIDFHRTPLPHDVPAGEAVRVLVQMPLPPDPGRYVLRFDPVDEGVSWFSQLGSPTLDLEVRVDPDALGQRLAARVEPIGTGGLLPVAAGVRVRLPVRVTNLGPSAWPALALPRRGSIRLGAQLLDETGRPIERDFARYDLPQGLEVGESAEVEVRFRAPEPAGRYVIRLDMLQEEICWFAQRGSQPLDVPVVVTAEVPDSRDPGILRAAIEVLEPPPVARASRGSRLAIRVRVTNRGNTRWLHWATDAIGQVALGGRFRREDAPPEAAEDCLRAPLPADVMPGESVELVAELQLPVQPGRYVLLFDMVDEAIAWFGSEGSPAALQTLIVS